MDFWIFLDYTDLKWKNTNAESSSKIMKEALQWRLQEYLHLLSLKLIISMRMKVITLCFTYTIQRFLSEKYV